MCLQVKSLEPHNLRGIKAPPLEPPEGVWACWYLDFRLLAFRKRENKGGSCVDLGKNLPEGNCCTKEAHRSEVRNQKGGQWCEVGPPGLQG